MNEDESLQKRNPKEDESLQKGDHNEDESFEIPMKMSPCGKEISMGMVLG